MTISSRATAYISSEANNITQEWIRECDEKHKICNRSVRISEFILPRRLLDIGIPGSKSPFLVETASLPEKNCRYAALSHRWGDPDKLLQTLSTNIHEHYERIPWDALSKTFQDAITVSHCLGLRYLWIDSLCIVQKDKTDFETECSSMHLIYLHSYCMIAASDAQDGLEGFLEFWNDCSQSISDNLVLVPQTSTQIPAFRPQSPDFRHNQYIKWSEWTKMLDGPLNKRGWTYQERQLAPRILHFTKHGIMWECRLCIGAGDSRKLQLRRCAWGLENKNFSSQGELFRILDRDQSRLSIDDVMLMWIDTIEGYSDRHLSFVEDKLPALSGLAAAISDIITERSAQPPTYLAGLWISHMHRQLFWCPVTPGHDGGASTQRPRKQHWLPSWSWASSNIPVTFSYTLARFRNSSEAEARAWRGRHFESVQNLLPHDALAYTSTDITPKGADPFGRIKGGMLQITGCFLEGTLKPSAIMSPLYQGILRCHQQVKYDIGIAFDFDLFPLKKESLLRFLVMLYDRRFDELCYGIVLQANDEGYFRRIGIFTVEFDKYSRIHYKIRQQSGTMTLI